MEQTSSSIGMVGKNSPKPQEAHMADAFFLVSQHEATRSVTGTTPNPLPQGVMLVRKLKVSLTTQLYRIIHLGTREREISV